MITAGPFGCSLVEERCRVRRRRFRIGGVSHDVHRHRQFTAGAHAAGGSVQRLDGATELIGEHGTRQDSAVVISTVKPSATVPPPSGASLAVGPSTV